VKAKRAKLFGFRRQAYKKFKHSAKMQLTAFELGCVACVQV
jgi:hypothetical protein